MEHEIDLTYIGDMELFFVRDTTERLNAFTGRTAFCEASVKALFSVFPRVNTVLSLMVMVMVEEGRVSGLSVP